MIELKQGQSTTIGILIADGYDMSNIDNVYLYINQTKFTPAIIDRMLRVEMSSKTTSVFIGTSTVRLIFDDKTFGRREYVLENIVWEATKARVYDDSVDLGYTVTYPITISEAAIEAGDVMYDYVKGAAGSLSSVTASVDSNVGTPEVTVTYDGENADFAFKNLKGDKGEQGEQGEHGEKGDDAVLPANIVIDSNYVHTDNNYTDEDAQKVQSAIQTETDPTVPAWAKEPTKPTYTANEVGAEPAKGANDNYVTDAEKTKLSNLSGTNTGDQDLSCLAPINHTHSHTALLDKNAEPSFQHITQEQKDNLDLVTQEYFTSISEQLYSYGILIDNRFSSPSVTRIGNLELHKTLPIHSNIKGCLLLDDGTVNYYLNPNNWAQKADGTPSNLDGTDGMVMVEIPQYYVKYSIIDDNQKEVRISTVPIAGYVLKQKRYVSAYKASLQRSNNKLSSVINLTADFRGGNNNATNDASSKSYLGRPVTSKNLTDFRTYARNRAAGTRWNCMTYDIRKSLYWLFAIEYANLNSQAAVLGRNAITGYMEGGLGNGMTNANGTEWGNFNGYNPFVPCGASNALGNGSGEVNYVAADFGGAGVNRTFTIPRFRGVESPFGDIWEWTDGILIDVKTDASGGTSTLYTSNTPANFSSISFAAYSNKGLLPRSEGWIKDIIFGVDGDILPRNVQGGGSNTYYCDHYWRDISWNSIRGVVFGSSADVGSFAGLVSALTNNTTSSALTYFGSRLCFV